MITLEARGPVKETELFVDALCAYGFVKTYSQTYKNIERTKSLIEMEAGTPIEYIEKSKMNPGVDYTGQRFVTEEMIPDRPRKQ